MCVVVVQRAGAVAEMNVVDNMHSYAQIARAYADNTEGWRPHSTRCCRDRGAETVADALVARRCRE
jgi:hypothetical protein